MELNEKWKLTTQNNAYLWEGNQISKQNRYPWFIMSSCHPPVWPQLYTLLDRGDGGDPLVEADQGLGLHLEHSLVC